MTRFLSSTYVRRHFAQGLVWALMVAAVSAQDESAANRDLVLRVNPRLWNERDLSVLDDYVAEDVEYRQRSGGAAGRCSNVL
ncbi:MAG: hypothetical protein J6386_02815 [Candidatus Synoicihabitans palmerolidicus]|nr:hypothetical protein [Candidatus Synoicihabitans palmerolidicus]